MALASYSCKIVVDNAPQLHHQPRNATTTRYIGGGSRRLLLSSTAAVLLAAETTEPDSKTALLQKYLKKSEENKAKNDKERLDNFYKRNYKEYFGFVEGTLRAKDKEQLSESERGILDWLDKNK